MKNLKELTQKTWNLVPTKIFVAYVISIVCMNLMANKVIFQYGDLFSVDGGTLISWIPFLCMDTVTQKLGSKVAIRLNTIAVTCNLLCVALFTFVSAIPGNGEDYSAFNTTFGGTWFVLLSSTVACLVSAIVNSTCNSTIKKLFKDVTKKSYIVSCWVSTFVGQSIDNFIFSFLTFHIFAPKYWGFSLSLKTCVGCAIVGAVIELGTECIFTPVGYHILKKWEEI